MEVSDRVFSIRQERAIASLVDYARFVIRYCWDDSAGILYHALGKGLKGSRNTGVWTYQVCDVMLYALPYLESGQEKELLLERTAEAFRTAGRIIRKTEEGCRFIAGKNSNFIINAGPRCAYHMLQQETGGK